MEDLVVWKRIPRGLNGHQSVSLAPTGTMFLLYKCVTIVSKSYSGEIPVLMNNMFKGDLKTYLLHPNMGGFGDDFQFEDFRKAT